jgi:hypothetical protein
LREEVIRSANDRRSGHDRRNLSPADVIALELCRRAGVLFIGIQSGFGHVPAQLLFQREQRSTTLAVKAEGATVDDIEERLRGHRLIEVTFFEQYYPAPKHANGAEKNAVA